MIFSICCLCVIVICLTWRTERQKNRMDELERDLFLTQMELERMRDKK